MADSIIHYNAVRPRVKGSGNLKLRFLTIDEVEVEQIVPIVMEDPANRLPIRLTNTKEQRVQLEFKIDEIDSYFDINKITIYVKPLWSEYPG